MLSKIIQAINGKIKFCLRNDRTFFVSDCSINDNIITFTDDVDYIEYKEDLNNIDLITFANKTIPTQIDLDNIKSFFEVNAEDHRKNNITFDELLQKCNEYKKIFNKQSISKIKEAVLYNNTLEIDMLAKLGSKDVISLENCSSGEASLITTLYVKLIDEKLNKALIELNQCISDMDDKEFEQEAIIIKKDLIDNVNDFKRSINNIELKDLFNNWPTLLNPSPFNIHV
jgi:hypothetical protein